MIDPEKLISQTTILQASVLEIAGSKAPDKEVFNFIMSKLPKIKRLSNECKKSIIYQKQKNQMTDFYSGLRARIKKQKDSHVVFITALFLHLSERIANAPTKIHMYGMIVLILPLIERAITEVY